jgi:hypothetical protein
MGKNQLQKISGRGVKLMPIGVLLICGSVVAVKVIFIVVFSFLKNRNKQDAL